MNSKPPEAKNPSRKTNEFHHWLHPSVTNLVGQQSPRLVVFRSGALGDTILLLPTIEFLRQTFDDPEITIVGSPWARRLIPLMPAPWNFFPYESSDLLPLFTDESTTPDIPRNIAEADLCLVYTGKPGDAMVRRLERSVKGLVLASSSDPPAENHAACHFAEAILQQPISPGQLPCSPLRAPPKARQEAENWVRKRQPRWAKGTLIVHPGSGSPRKCWPADRFASVIRTVRDKDIEPILLEGPADRKPSEAVCRNLARSPSVCRHRDLKSTAGLLLTAGCCLTNDSGIGHLAGALGIRTLSIFGPTNPTVWKPLGPAVKTIRAGSHSKWPECSRVEPHLNWLLGATA
ncbi:MAG: glycosyltransferase family 9 protein [Candidatus Brocadiia bacterium]